MILHNTCQPDIYYTAFTNLPQVIQDFINKHYESLARIRCDNYTCYRSVLFIYHYAVIDGINYRLEITLGDIQSGFTGVLTESEIEEEANYMLECIDFECLDVYLEEMKTTTFKEKVS